MAEDDETETLAAIIEMAEEKYACTVVEHDAEQDEFLVTWKDNDDQEWGCWFSRRLLNEIFTTVTIN